jgi:hypothetical protein
MATVRKEWPLPVPAAAAWDVVRDVGAVHTRLAPGFVTSSTMERSGDMETRVLTFFNGLVARETILSVDDAAMRLAYTARSERLEHHNGVLQIVADGANCRAVWTIDLLPHAMAPAIGQMMDAGAKAMQGAMGGRSKAA